MRFRLIAFLLLAPAVAAAQDLVATTPPLTPEEQRARFKLPPGFEIQLVAAEPDIVKPMNLAFDDRGRLLVTQSYEYPYPNKDGKPRDTVRLLQDFGPDGRARKITVYADGLNIPIGVMATLDGAVAYSIPKVWRFKGVDAAESREAILGDCGIRDTHGMLNAFTPWIDGWTYACHGFSNKSTLRNAAGQEITLSSGNTWRMKPDGSALQQYTHGQVNPFGLSFDPLGNLYSADCHSLPAYALLRGGWYPTFDGKHDGLGHAPSILSHLHGSTGIAGIIYYDSDHFPPQYRDTLFIGNPVTRRINTDRLERRGSSLRAIETPDFLTCDDPWFRPVDLEFAPDGSMYVADFYNCIIGHYEVPLDHPKRDKTRGRIWRIVAKDRPLRAVPDLHKAPVDALVKLLDDETLPLRVKATNQLVERIGPPAVEAVLKAFDTPRRKAHGLWILERLGALDEARVRALAADGDALVRVHLLKALADRPTWTFEAALVREKLLDPDAYARRAAAEGLALHPDAANLQPLIAAWAATPAEDTHLVYMCRKAVRDQLLAPGMFAKAVAAGVDAGRLADVCVAIPTAECAAFLLDRLKAGPLHVAQLRHVLRHGDRLPEALALLDRLKELDPRSQLNAVRESHRALTERGAPPRAGFGAEVVVRALGEKGLQTDAVKLARELKLKGAYDAIAQLLRAPSGQDEPKVSAVDALAALDGPRAVPELLLVTADDRERPAVRMRAIQALASINTPESRAALLERLRLASQAAAVSIASGLAGSRDGAEALLKAVEEGKASRRLLLDNAVKAKVDAAGGQSRRRALTADLPPEDDRIKQMIDARRSGYAKAQGDVERGKAVFTKTCAGCHKVAGLGQKIGPELDGVGHRGLDRLLEDVLDPNRAVDAAFRATMIKTKDGRVLSGLVLREEGQVLVVQEAADKETRLALEDIESRKLSDLSPMPANVVEPLTEADFYDLVKFLLEQKPK
jgi:putative heme-binding domain-containing protein